MYICPTCNRKFKTGEEVAKHSLSCWRQHNPNHRSKPAPRSDDIVHIEINDDVVKFFKDLNNADSKT